MRFKGLSMGFFLLILAIVTVAFFEVLAPYFSPILWAAVLTVIFHPLKTFLRTRLSDRNGLASLLTLLCICLIVFTPLAIITSSLAVEINTVYTKLQTNSTQFPIVFAQLMQHLPDWATHYLAEHNLDSATAIQQKLSGLALKGDSTPQAACLSLAEAHSVLLWASASCSICCSFC